MFNIFILGNVFEHGRLSLSESYNPSWYAALLGLGIILSTTNFSIGATPIKKLFWGLVVLLFLFVLIFTQGRNAMIALFLAGMITVITLYTKDLFKFIFYLVLKKRLANSMGIFIGGFIFIIFGVIYIVNTYPDLLTIERLMRIQSGNLDSITSNRATIWSNYFSIMEFDYHAFFGHGLWSSAFIYEDYYGIVKPPHNTFISVFFELGIVGLILYLSFLIALGLYVFKQKGIFAKASQTTFLYALFLNFGNDMLTYKYFWITIFFSILLTKYNRLFKTSNNNLHAFK
ncbi:MAG: O-antigen ligase family protein [Nanoarchaeota archaeon]